MEENDFENDEFLQGLLPQIISREEWGAMESKNKRKLKTPVSRIVFSSTKTSRCYSKAHCIHNLKKYQKESFDESRNDIPYNFLIGRDGRVYEGMGWTYQADCNYSSWLPSDRPHREIYETSIDVAFIGPKEKPSTKQIKAALGLLILGIQNNTLSENVDILENNVVGPIFPQDELRMAKGEYIEGEEKDGSKELNDDQLLELVNQFRKEKDKITKEQMLEELKDIDIRFKEFDEKLKIENQRFIEKNYPWHFKSKSKNKS